MFRWDAGNFVLTCACGEHKKSRCHEFSTLSNFKKVVFQPAK